MANTTTATASWGVGTASPVTGVMTDYSDSTEAVDAPEQNEVGQVIGDTVYDKRETVNCTVQVAAGTAKPDVGSQISINSKNYIVKNSTVTENNNSYRKIAVTAERYIHCESATVLS